MTTDPQDEMFPIVNVNDEVIGMTTRKDANSNPNIIHRAAGVFVFDQDGKVLIQRRSETKDTFPDCLDISVGGHVNFGDDYLQTAIRETSEELGLVVNEQDLEFLGKILIKLPWENEFWHLYKYNLPIEYKLNSNNEVSSMEFMSINEIRESLNNKNEKWSDKARQQINEFLLK